MSDDLDQLVQTMKSLSLDSRKTGAQQSKKKKKEGPKQAGPSSPPPPKKTSARGAASPISSPSSKATMPSPARTGKQEQFEASPLLGRYTTVVPDSKTSSHVEVKRSLRLIQK